MGKDILASTGQLPAHLRKGAVDQDEWGTGLPSGFPVLSIKGKTFAVRRGEESDVVCDKETGEQATGINIVVLKTHQGVAKVYYDKGYEEGNTDAPTCFSLDGIAPSNESEDRQSKKCATCPKNEWGSRITENGANGKACSDQKRLAVAAAGQLNDPMLLRVPPTSLKSWDNYVSSLVKRGVTPDQVITRISFDPKVAHQVLVFKPVDFVDAEQYAEIEGMQADATVQSIIGSISSGASDAADSNEGDDDGVEEDGAEEPAKPKPKAKPKAKPRAKPKPKPEPEPEPEPEGDDDDDADGLDLDDLDLDDLDFGDDD